METDILWVYDDVDNNTTVIDGGSPGAAVVLEKARDFLTRFGYRSSMPEAESNQLVIQPPLTTEHLYLLGQFCMQDHINRQFTDFAMRRQLSGFAIIDRRNNQLRHGLGRQVVRY